MKVCKSKKANKANKCHVELRDYFAAHVVCGLAANNQNGGEWDVEYAACHAYLVADAMLIARRKRP